MKRTTVMLPERLKSRAERSARKRGISLGELIRSSLEAALVAGRRSRLEDPLFADKQTFHDNSPADVAENHEKYFADVLIEEYQREQWR